MLQLYEAWKDRSPPLFQYNCSLIEEIVNDNENNNDVENIESV